MFDNVVQVFIITKFLSTCSIIEREVFNLLVSQICLILEVVSICSLNCTALLLGTKYLVLL